MSLDDECAEYERGYESRPGFLWVCTECGRVSRNRLLGTGGPWHQPGDWEPCCVAWAIHWPLEDLHYGLNGRVDVVMNGPGFETEEQYWRRLSRRA